MNNFAFGTQYLRGASPRQECWEKDLKLIAASGFNTIRVWLVWGVVEVREGVIDYDYIERILSLAEQQKLRVIFLFHLHGAPEWLIRKYPQYRYVDREGNAFEPSARANTPSGGWPGLCPDHKEVQELEERFIREVVTYIGDRAFAYEPINEPHQWVDIAAPQPKEYCFCEATRELFRQWLKRKYGTLEALGNAWGRYFDSWESVRPATWAFGYGDRLDFRRFTAEQVALLVRRRANAIRKYTSRPVIAHAWGGGSSCCGQLETMAFDDWQNAAEVDLWGCSGFPSKVEMTPRLAQSMDATRSAAAGKTFWQAELGVGSIASGLVFAPPASPELLATWCWESIFHGAKGVLFWQFREEFFGNESGHFGMVSRDGSPTKRLEATSGVARCVKQYEADFMSSKVPAAQAALIFSPDAYMLNGIMQNDNSFCSQAISGYYEAFYQAGIPLDILHCGRLSAEELKKYKLIVVPGIITLGSKEGGLLADYVRGGGNLLLDPLTGSWDEHAVLSETLPGAGLAALAGVAGSELTEVNGGAFNLQWGKKQYKLPRKYAFARWEKSAQTETPILDADGNAYFYRTNAGAGRIWLSGIALGNLNSSGLTIGDDFRDEDGTSLSGTSAELILDLAAECGVESEFSFEGKMHAMTLVLPDGGEFLLVSNLSNEAVTAKISSPKRAGQSYKGISGTDDVVFSAEGEAVFTLKACASALLKK